jgi:ribosomal protein S8
MHEITKENAAEVAAKVAAARKPAASLAEAVCRVMDAVGYVQKDKQMQGGGSYKYVSVEAVIDALRPEMIRQQLVMLPAAVEPLTIETFEGKNGGRQNRTQVKYTFKLLHAPSGQAESVVVIGEAIDVGDKSSNKAMTAARKYALIMAFNIETGLDPDDTPSATQERKPATQPAADRDKFNVLINSGTPSAAAPAKPAQPASGLRGLASNILAQLRNAKSRKEADPAYKQYEQGLDAGAFSVEEEKALKVAWTDFGKRFPKPEKV